MNTKSAESYLLFFKEIM